MCHLRKVLPLKFRIDDEIFVKLCLVKNKSFQFSHVYMYHKCEYFSYLNGFLLRREQYIHIFWTFFSVIWFQFRSTFYIENGCVMSIRNILLLFSRSGIVDRERESESINKCWQWCIVIIWHHCHIVLE